jgi:hypothetical protein
MTINQRPTDAAGAPSATNAAEAVAMAPRGPAAAPPEREGGAPQSTADMVAAADRNERVAPSSLRPAAEAPMDSEDAERGDRTRAEQGTQALTSQPNGTTPVAAAPASLLAPDEAAAYRSRWEGVQSGFVDEPRRAVEQADQLVAGVIKHVAEVFAEERGKLEEQWSRGGEADTEDLRVALQRYRTFFERLLAA